MYRITAVVISIIISATSMMYSVFVPTLPYLPPADVQILDVIHNAYGLTIPQIDNAEKRLETYWNAYRAIMGSAYDTFRTDMQDVIDNAKTSRKITLSVNTQAMISEVMKQVLANGYEYSEGEIIPEPSTNAELVQWFRSKGYNGVDNIVNQLWNYNLGNQSIPKVYGIIRQSNVMTGEQTAILTAQRKRENATFTMQPSGNSTFILQKVGETTVYEASIWYVIRYNFDTKTYTQISNAQTSAGFSVCDGVAYNNTATQIWSNDTGAEKKEVSALNSDVASAISNKTLIPLTADTVIENGAIDGTKPVNISLPNNMPTPATTVTELQGVLDDIGVVPISENPAQTVTQLREEAMAKYGDASEYALDLTRYFPFCLPFDIARILQAFVAEPEAPKFSYTIENPFSDDEEDNIVLEIDLAMFDEVASILRTLECILFVVGLAVVTRSLYLRG